MLGSAFQPYTTSAYKDEIHAGRCEFNLMIYIKRGEREEGINGEGEDGEGSGRDKGKTRAGNER